MLFSRNAFNFLPFRLRAHKPLRKRSAVGATLVELSIVTGVMAFLSTAIFGVLALTLSSSRKLDNETDSVQAVRLALDRIGRDVRMARSFGDVFGTVVDSHGSGIVAGNATFPAPNNPIVPGDYAWPRWVDGSQPTSFTLNSDTLIIQIPVFDANGFPLQIVDGDGNPHANVETHVYRVLHRPGDPTDEYCIQVMIVPGANSTVVSRPPSTIVTGIIGPLSGGSPVPRVFEYVDKWNTSAPQFSFGSGQTNLADYVTVCLNLEIRKHISTAERAQAGNNRWKDSAVWAVKQDLSIRNNAQATTVGVPMDPAELVP